MPPQQEIAMRLIETARSYGATLGGIVNVAELYEAALIRTYPIDDRWLREGRSVLVLALAHPADQPRLDWWGTENGTEGNHRLKNFCERLRHFLAREYKIKGQVLKYQPGNLGVYLKDAAVLAGLGTIGANNLLITEQYGPQIRLRGLLMDVDLPSTGAMLNSPCDSCGQSCRQACPQQAFASGSFNRMNCRVQMRKDEINRRAVETEQRGWVSFVKYCRACELSCPVGRTT